MCWTALPPHLDSPQEIEDNFQDDNAVGPIWRRFKKWIKPHLAYGPRDIHWYHRWRKLPITLLSIFGKGESRWEDADGVLAVRSVNQPVFFYRPWTLYLSRIQYWCDWSIQLQWPLFLCFHFKYGRKGLVHGYIGAKRDGDCYWFPALHFGGSWK